MKFIFIYVFRAHIAIVVVYVEINLVDMSVKKQLRNLHNLSGLNQFIIPCTKIIIIKLNVTESK